MKYNITFTLGDPSGDGHANTSVYHMVANHSVKDITDAYQEFVRETGFDYVGTIGAEYQPDMFIPAEFTEKLLELGIITDEYVTKEGDNWTPAGCYEFEDSEEEFLTIFTSIIQYKLPDFKWEYRDLEEDNLCMLDGAAYGFAYYGE